MILAWIIFFSYSLFALYDLRKAILIWMPAQLLFNSQVALRYASPALYLNLSVTIVLFLLYYFKGLGKYKDNETFLFKPILILNLISYGFSLMFSIVPFSQVFMETVRTFMNTNEKAVLGQNARMYYETHFLRDKFMNRLENTLIDNASKK